MSALSVDAFLEQPSNAYAVPERLERPEFRPTYVGHGELHAVREGIFSREAPSQPLWQGVRSQRGRNGRALSWQSRRRCPSTAWCDAGPRSLGARRRAHDPRTRHGSSGRNRFGSGTHPGSDGDRECRISCSHSSPATQDLPDFASPATSTLRPRTARVNSRPSLVYPSRSRRLALGGTGTRPLSTSVRMYEATPGGPLPSTTTSACAASVRRQSV